ncbi:MAG: hypothetical protein KIPDCIKN_02834 [Haliscomenobacter sp.]|nr:hypothetical protein [Haliscomenobacter sp.]
MGQECGLRQSLQEVVDTRQEPRARIDNQTHFNEQPPRPLENLFIQIVLIINSLVFCNPVLRYPVTSLPRNSVTSYLVPRKS